MLLHYTDFFIHLIHLYLFSIFIRENIFYVVFLLNKTCLQPICVNRLIDQALI